MKPESWYFKNTQEIASERFQPQISLTLETI